LLFCGSCDRGGAQARFDAEAVRLNNRGVAQMGQQFTERAAESFAEAFKKDPKLAQAAINEGIALLALQKLDEAKNGTEAGASLWTRTSAQAWYNLGLAQHAGNELEPALASFQQAVKLDPRDADSYYFRGRLLPGDEGVREGHCNLREGAGDQPAARFGGVWTGAGVAAHRPHRGGEGALQALSAFDQHQDSSADRAGLWRAGALLDCDAG
jgi:tetratricopeptide (TPR) repeat protein